MCLYQVVEYRWSLPLNTILVYINIDRPVLSSSSCAAKKSSSSNLRGPLTGDLQFASWRLPGFLDENPDDNHALAARGQIDGSGNSVPAFDSQFPKLVIEMFDGFAWQGVETVLLDQSCQPRKPRAHNGCRLSISSSTPRLSASTVHVISEI